MSYLEDTASLRGPTGLDQGARQLIMRAVEEEAAVQPDAIVGALFRDNFGSPGDYFAAVQEARGGEPRRVCEQAVQMAVEEQRMSFEIDEQAPSRALLLTMPEHDFMRAIKEVVVQVRRPSEIAKRINKVCLARGVPYQYDVRYGFEWVGDSEISYELVQPALAAIHDRRFSGGVREEFEKARSELREGTASTRRQAVHEAGRAVESAMKVVLAERGIHFNETDAGKRLFDHLVSNSLVPSFMEQMVFAVLTPRNKIAAHGAGAVAHDPGDAEAASVVAAAAGAIAYLYTKLP